MTNHNHFIQFLLESGDHPREKFTCEAGEHAECRRYCATCESESRERCECEYYGVFYDQGNLLSEGRDPVYRYGSCNYLNWMDDAPGELYQGDRMPVRGPDPQPVTFHWEGGYFTWRYAEASTTAK